MNKDCLIPTDKVWDYTLGESQTNINNLIYEVSNRPQTPAFDPKVLIPVYQLIYSNHITLTIQASKYSIDKGNPEEITISWSTSISGGSADFKFDKFSVSKGDQADWATEGDSKKDTPTDTTKYKIVAQYLVPGSTDTYISMNKETTVNLYYPCFAFAGKYTDDQITPDVIRNGQAKKIQSSPSGSYTIKCEDLDYFYFAFPSGYTYSKVTYGGFGFEVSKINNVNPVVNGGTYDVYKSVNTYNAGTHTITFS